MDGTNGRISPQELYSVIGTAAAPLVIDVRQPSDFDVDDSQIAGAIRRLPADSKQWQHQIPDGRRVVVYCVHGGQEAEFIYVPATTVLETAKRTHGTPYDIANVEFGHHGEFCSFDAFLQLYGISDAALDRLALIVRGADTDRPDLTPQSRGLLAISQGLKINFTNDHEMLAQGMVVYDALYAWCRAQEKAANGRT